MWESYYLNGKLRYKAKFKNGEEDGLWETYHESGHLWHKGVYKEGLREGPWVFYHDIYKGKIEIIKHKTGFYKAGKKIRDLDK